MTELKPCPFCGEENAVKLTSEESYDIVKDENFCIVCDFQGGGCGASSGVRRTAEDAIKAWNTQVERTCKMTMIEPPKILEGWWSCSECGPVFPPCNDEIAKWALVYCPHCGAKVVKE